MLLYKIINYTNYTNIAIQKPHRISNRYQKEVHCHCLCQHTSIFLLFILLLLLVQLRVRQLV